MTFPGIPCLTCLIGRYRQVKEQYMELLRLTSYPYRIYNNIIEVNSVSSTSSLKVTTALCSLFLERCMKPFLSRCDVYSSVK